MNQDMIAQMMADIEATRRADAATRANIVVGGGDVVALDRLGRDRRTLGGQAVVVEAVDGEPDEIFSDLTVERANDVCNRVAAVARAPDGGRCFVECHRTVVPKIVNKNFAVEFLDDDLVRTAFWIIIFHMSPLSVGKL